MNHQTTNPQWLDWRRLLGTTIVVIFVSLLAACRPYDDGTVITRVPSVNLADMLIDVNIDLPYSKEKFTSQKLKPEVIESKIELEESAIRIMREKDAKSAIQSVSRYKNVVAADYSITTALEMK